jgi:hypothetical protein
MFRLRPRIVLWHERTFRQALAGLLTLPLSERARKLLSLSFAASIRSCCSCSPLINLFISHIGVRRAMSSRRLPNFSISGLVLDVVQRRGGLAASLPKRSVVRTLLAVVCQALMAGQSQLGFGRAYVAMTVLRQSRRRPWRSPLWSPTEPQEEAPKIASLVVSEARARSNGHCRMMRSHSPIPRIQRSVTAVIHSPFLLSHSGGTNRLGDPWVTAQI